MPDPIAAKMEMEEMIVNTGCCIKYSAGTRETCEEPAAVGECKLPSSFVHYRKPSYDSAIFPGYL